MFVSADRREKANVGVLEGNVRKHFAVQLEEFHRQEPYPSADFHYRHRRRRSARRRCTSGVWSAPRGQRVRDTRWTKR